MHSLEKDSIEYLKAELLQHKQNYQLVIDHSPISIVYVDSNYQYQIANKKYYEWNGKGIGDILGLTVSEVLSHEVFHLIKPKMDIALSGKEINFEAKVSNSIGEKKWVYATYVPDIDDDGTTKGFYAFILDIDERKRESLQLQQLMRGIETGMEGFALHNKEGDFTYVNPVEANMYGYKSNELLGKSWKLLYNEQQTHKIEEEYFPRLLDEGKWRGELRGLKKTGEYFDVEVSLSLLKDESGNDDGIFCSCRDISERKRSQEKVNFLAYHDSLTELPNRILFKERLEQAIIRAKRRNTIIGVLFIDLDLFKHINDTLGHSAGDQLLQLVAKRIRDVLRLEDTVARLSGDEFTILLNDIKNKKSIEEVLYKLINAFYEPFLVADKRLQQSISIGISTYPEDGEDVETLMKNADAAMYHVKEQGRKSFKFYNPGIGSSAYENILYRTQLQNALDEDEFRLFYQPIICVRRNKIIGFEALIRWQHKEKGLVSPDKFIQFAEESNLIIPIGYWVIETVCKQIKEWNEIGIDIEKMSINVSGIQLQQDFVSQVDNILKSNNISPELIELEITETFLMKGLKQAVEQLNELRSIGLSLAIDDFGVGYSSFSQLKQLPTHCLKIDRSFVGDIVSDPDDLEIVKAIIALAKSLKLIVIAEGVETIEQYKLLQEFGCDKVQGYYFSKPCPAAEIPELCDSLNKEHMIKL